MLSGPSTVWTSLTRPRHQRRRCPAVGCRLRWWPRRFESWAGGWRVLEKMLLWPRDHPPSDHGSGDRAALRRVSPDRARETTAGEYVQGNSSAAGRNSYVSGA